MSYSNALVIKFAALLLLFTFGNVAFAIGVPQEATEDAKELATQEAEDELATIKGSALLDSTIIEKVDWDTLQGTLGEIVIFQQPELPDGWAEMSVEKRREWEADFLKTDDGKALAAANQKLLDERHVQTFQLRSKGEFIVYDVPSGRFQMRIFGQVEVDEKTFVLQSFGQFEVGEVDEMDFSNMKLDVLRLLKMGEAAPEITGMSSSGKRIALSDFEGKHVLLAFGLTANPAFESTTRILKEASNSKESKGKLEVLTVTVDEDLDAIQKFNKLNDVDWNCLNLGKWDQDVLNSYGLKSVPSIWLIDADGNVLLTAQQLFYELNRTQFSLAKLIDEAIAGRLVIGGEPEENPEDSEANGEPDKARK